jgi:hypothetical protein
MSCINYTIASYPGKTSSRIFQDNSEYVLTIQLKHLQVIFENKIKNGIDNLIKQITIVRTKPKDSNYYLKYYEVENLQDICGVPIVFLDYEGDNTNHSYDQWLQSYVKYNDIEYHLFIEDDYCIDTDNLTFDKELVDLYKKTFPNNNGYLCSLTAIESGILCASISNGFIHRSNINKISLDKFYNSSLPYGSYYRNPQIQFSKIMIENGINIVGMNDKYLTYFWDTQRKSIVDYTVAGINSNKKNFIPVQISEICNSFLSEIKL